MNLEFVFRSYIWLRISINFNFFYTLLNSTDDKIPVSFPVKRK